jgi:hypothetical protein
VSTGSAHDQSPDLLGPYQDVHGSKHLSRDPSPTFFRRRGQRRKCTEIASPGEIRLIE